MWPSSCYCQFLLLFVLALSGGFGTCVLALITRVTAQDTAVRIARFSQGTTRIAQWAGDGLGTRGAAGEDLLKVLLEPVDSEVGGGGAVRAGPD
jgi:hypothetical protein